MAYSSSELMWNDCLSSLHPGCVCAVGTTDGEAMCVVQANLENSGDLHIAILYGFSVFFWRYKPTAFLPGRLLPVLELASFFNAHFNI